MKNPFRKKKISAYEAIHEAHKIAFGPLIFQAARTMRDLGILQQLEQGGTEGVSAQTIADNLELSLYGVETLLESGLSCDVAEMTDDGLFTLSKIGHFLLNDTMTQINMDYNHYVNYQGMFYLDEAIKAGKPAGLKVFGKQWETLYQALPHLPEKVKNSWYCFDHFYSDSAYPDSLPIIFRNQPRTMLDIGTNIGKFTLLAAEYNPDIEITMVDLPDQLQNAVNHVESAGLSSRVQPLAMDLLDEGNGFPHGIDIYWLSQFLSCFGKQEIISILRRIAEAMDVNSTVYILETCWDRQRHVTSAYSLVNTSLYFTALASGNSKMYNSQELQACIDAAGLTLSQTYDNLGLCHTLFECRK
ncbi:MAG: SAM-dependent methyltransferase [Candidatus Thiodiazotropha sp. (ex Epidulcina cf. delphinae)]|nr:SAM-dependent methyltransferase [Candidatus Thiodiazotropha sp. (ex Epidulcina cf. delphinae)]